MSKLTSLIRRAPKRFSALVLMVAAAIIIPVAAQAWGPDRDTFTIANPAGYVTFNSITDNPEHGDERNFMQIREANANNSTYADDITIQANHEYVVYMYYHNNASTTLNDAAHNYAGIALGAYTKAAIPYIVPQGTTKEAAGYVGAINATPKEVWDDIRLKNTSSSDLLVNFVTDSATIHNFGASSGSTMSNNIVTTGAPLGFDSLNGELPGCNQYAGYVTFRIKVTEPSFTLSKEVRVAGQTEWKENVNANPGDTLEYKVQYKNTGSVKQNNVIVKDTLPTHVSYIAGSTVLTNNSNPNGKTVSDNLTNGVGINIGNYSQNSIATLIFKAKVAAKEALNCGTTLLHNVARAETEYGSKEDGADATVTKTCEPGKISVCELSTKKIITINESDFNSSKHSKDLSVCGTVPELPKTGPTENIVAIVGLGALIASLVYYIASRRALNQ
jgi:uncharacterized repeat protein (TIGR01451 family)/LPXTG-motif cell wall-anchored protein